MTRKGFREHRFWSRFMICMGIANVGAMLPQLYTIIDQRSAHGVSLAMYVYCFFIQAVFGFDAWLHGNRRFMICMIMALTVTTAIIASIIHYRP